MSLLRQWQQDPAFLESKHVRQIIAIAGDGRLRDGGTTSVEFRDFIRSVSPEMLARFSRECLEESFTDSGLVLQDLVNEIGRRIGFKVVDGRYRGTKSDIGNDGLWQLLDGRALVVEIKTTDAYRINLDTVSGYLQELRACGALGNRQGSVLIVVGRNDTGDLEAQVRGSRHAWDMRLISIEALVKLMLLRSDLEDPTTVRRMHDVLFPKEFTRLDAIIDLAFETVSDARADIEEDVEEEQSDAHSVTTTTTAPKEKKFTPVAFNEACAKYVAFKEGLNLVKKSRASFASPDGTMLLLSLVSREHSRQGSRYYWFAFHKHQMDALENTATGLVALGCGSAEHVVLLNKTQLSAWVDGMNRTVSEERDYWHIQISEENGKLFLVRRASIDRIDLTTFLIQ